MVGLNERSLSELKFAPLGHPIFGVIGTSAKYQRPEEQALARPRRRQGSEPRSLSLMARTSLDARSAKSLTTRRKSGRAVLHSRAPLYRDRTSRSFLWVQKRKRWEWIVSIKVFILSMFARPPSSRRLGVLARFRDAVPVPQPTEPANGGNAGPGRDAGVDHHNDEPHATHIHRLSSAALRREGRAPQHKRVAPEYRDGSDGWRRACPIRDTCATRRHMTTIAPRPDCRRPVHGRDIRDLRSRA